MKTLKLFLLPLLKSLEFGSQVIRYVLIFVSAFFRQRASLGCEMVAMRRHSVYKDSIRQKRQPRLRFHPAFRLLWVLLSRVWSGWKFAAGLMKPKTVLKWHEHAFLQWWRWKSRQKGGRPAINQEMRALIRQLSRENVLWSASGSAASRINDDTPIPSAKPEPAADGSRLFSIPVVAGLHHRHIRVAA